MSVEKIIAKKMRRGVFVASVASALVLIAVCAMWMHFYIYSGAAIFILIFATASLAGTFFLYFSDSCAIEKSGDYFLIRKGQNVIWSGSLDQVEKITLDEIWTHSESQLTKSLVIIYLKNNKSFSFSARGFSRLQLEIFQSWFVKFL